MPGVGGPRRTAQSILPAENIPIEKPKELTNAGTEGQQQQVYVADDGAAVEIPPQHPTTTKPVTTTESAANNGIGSTTETDRSTDMSAGDGTVQEIFENTNDSTQPTGKEDVQNVMSAAVAAKRLRQRIPAPEEIMAAKSAAEQRRRGRPPKKVKSCPPMDTGKLHSQQKADTPTNQAQEELPPLTTTTLTTTTAGEIGPPTFPEKEEVRIGPQPTAEPIPKYPRVMGPHTVEKEKAAAVPIVGGEATTGEPKKEVVEKIGKMYEEVGKEESPGYALRSAKRQQQQQSQARLVAQSR